MLLINIAKIVGLVMSKDILKYTFNSHLVHRKDLADKAYP